MKTIVNKTRKPVKVPLPGSKFLYLGPLKSAQIADPNAATPAVVRLIQKGDIEIQGEGTRPDGGDGGNAPAHRESQGHKPTTVVLPKGNR